MSWVFFVVVIGCSGSGSSDSVPSSDTSTETDVDSEDTSSTPNVDEDGDGSSAGADCDDTDPSVFPGAVEVCDGLDQNCDQFVDEDLAATWYQDVDQDGYGGPVSTMACVAPPGAVSTPGDCDDHEDAIHPGVVEICNGRDDDCDGSVEQEVQDGGEWSFTDGTVLCGTLGVPGCPASLGGSYGYTSYGTVVPSPSDALWRISVSFQDPRSDAGIYLFNNLEAWNSEIVLVDVSATNTEEVVTRLQAPYTVMGYDLRYVLGVCQEGGPAVDTWFMALRIEP